MGYDVGYHGGNLDAAARLFPEAPSPWIDLSTGINPVPYPVENIPPTAWSRLPQVSDVAALEAAAAARYGAENSLNVVAAPGTQALIQCLPRVLSARRVGILGFTYGEHERSWRGHGADVRVVETLSELNGYDVAVVVNPNNPDGRLHSPEALTAAAADLAVFGGTLIIDEAFMDIHDRRMSAIPQLQNTRTIVLRSFGKIYGLAGIRLGFAVASGNLGSTLRDCLGPWAVSGPAIEIGRRALEDERWLRHSVARLTDDAARLDTLLRAAGFKIVGGTPLYRLVEDHDANGWFEHLARHGILVRSFPDRPRWLRFGLPDGAAAWRRLEAALFRL